MSSTLFPDVRRLEFDRSGVSADNHITDDYIDLPVAGSNRAIVLKHGAFYTDSLILKDDSGNILEKWVDYQPVYPYNRPELNITEMTGKDNAAFIMILNASLTGRVIADYQAVGIPSGIANRDLIDILDAIAKDARKYYWDDIFDKPDKFPPSPHPLDIKDTYNWAPMTEAMARFVDCLKHLDRLPTIQDYIDQIDTVYKDTLPKLNAVYSAFLTHRRNYSNPHLDVKTTVVNLNNVDDFDMATLAEVIAGTSSVKFMSPYTGSQAAYNTLLKNDTSLVHVNRVPMVQFGDLSTTAIPYTLAGFVLTITADVPAMLASREFTLKKGAIDLTKFVSAPANKTLFLYVRIRNGQASYEVASAASPETTTYINVGRIVTGASAITSVTINKISGLGTVRVSEVQIGSAIAVTSGLPSQSANLNW
ncbi:putative membrane protein [Erwinia phage vB_EamM_Mortimer]|uniref:Putative membrane protein n=1 Tax=Erwinia phage vB_EamM_Mortimer TaxID=2060129 RepID=A0A2H5BKD2_9CAUD|nr:putative membrane protein [Erwinia phage vB_EamM_Mortimer]